MEPRTTPSPIRLDDASGCRGENVESRRQLPDSSPITLRRLQRHLESPAKLAT
jgi:hypothetical protein